MEQFGADPNFTNSLGMTALHDGVSRKDLEIVRTLIKFGADPTIKSIKDDKSPLDMAAEKDLNEISQVLKTSSYLHNNNALLNGKLDSVATELDSISLTPEVSFFLLILLKNLFNQRLVYLRTYFQFCPTLKNPNQITVISNKKLGNIGFFEDGTKLKHFF